MSKNINSFKAFTDEDSQKYLAQCYPDGKLTANRFDSNRYIYKLINCCATFIKIITGQIYTIAKNTDIDKADELLLEWEKSVEIGTKYPILDTTEKRREAIKRKISKVPVYNIRPTTNDYTTIENYVEKTVDTTIEIEPAGNRLTTSSFPASFPIKFGIPYYKRQLLLIIKVDVGDNILANNNFPLPFPVRFFDADIPQATKDLLDIPLNDVVPSFMNWEYEILT